ncbi:MAG: hypothetical protein WCF84_24935 [Anaerolineae bacterium]
MTSQPIVTQLPLLPSALLPPQKAANQRTLHTYWQHPEQLPPFVAQCPTARRYLDLFGPLPWADLPERDLQRRWRFPAIPFRACVLAELIQLEEGFATLHALRRFLREHPSILWLLGLPLYPAAREPLGFNTRHSLPTQRHMTRMLRQLPNAALQALLTASVQVIRTTLADQQVAWGECVSVDTKHILAWVKENNPKAYVKQRFNKAHQPTGHHDCLLGCKRRHNQIRVPATPTRNPVPAQTVSVGEYYWGYGSGIVVTKVPDWGEFVLAELTQPFDHSDVSYFFPLMRQTAARLGDKPRFGTFDAAFDAWYVYAYFYRENDPAGGLAAVPFSEKGGYKANGRQFTAEGLPLCKAGLAMPLKLTFTDRTKDLIEHERGRYVCPLRFPQPTGQRGPIHHANWKRGGCLVEMPTSIGARLRYTLDRGSAIYKSLYRQRTAVERINSPAVALGIERPHLRSGTAIANRNTLIYLLINLRFLQRVRQRQHETE